MNTLKNTSNCENARLTGAFCRILGNYLIVGTVTMRYNAMRYLLQYFQEILIIHSIKIVVICNCLKFNESHF